MSDDFETMLKVSDVAERCKLSVGAVYQAIKEGRLHAARLGGRQALRIHPEELKRWIRENTQTTLPDPPSKSDPDPNPRPLIVL